MNKEKNEEKVATWARDQFAEELRASGLYSYVSEKSHSYADIVALTNGGTYKYFEIKASSISKKKLMENIAKGKKFFDAATLTEWNMAAQHPSDYTFVMLYIEDNNGKYAIVDREEYSPEELLRFSTVPPFKVNFNIPYKKGDMSCCVKHRNGTISAYNEEDTFSVIRQLISFFKKIGGVLKKNN